MGNYWLDQDKVTVNGIRMTKDELRTLLEEIGLENIVGDTEHWNKLESVKLDFEAWKASNE